MGWTPEQRQSVEQTFIGLCEFKKQKLSKVQVLIWFRILEKYDAKDVIMALETAIETMKWFPTPPEIVELIMGSATDRAAAAWIRFLEIIKTVSVLDSVIFEDTRFSAMVDYYGGWDKVHQWREDEMTWRRIDFMKVFSNFREPPPGKKHIGDIEHHNSSRGFLEHIPEPVFVPASGPIKKQLALPPPDTKMTEREQQLMLEFKEKKIQPNYQMVKDAISRIGGQT